MDSDSEELATVFPLPKYKAPAKKIRNTTTAIINFLSILLPLIYSVSKVFTISSFVTCPGCTLTTFPFASIKAEDGYPTIPNFFKN